MAVRLDKNLRATIDKVVASVPSYYANFEIVNGEIDISREVRDFGNGAGDSAPFHRRL